jgi:hypothetical protein
MEANHRSTIPVVRIRDDVSLLADVTGLASFAYVVVSETLKKIAPSGAPRRLSDRY